MLKEFLIRTRIPLMVSLIFNKYPKLKQNLDYDVYWGTKIGKKLCRLDPFQLNILKLILTEFEQNKTLLDIGSGDGSVLNFLTKHRKFDSILPTDISKTAIDNLKKEGYPARFLNIQDEDEFSKLDSFDYVMVLEVLEHITDSETVLKRLLNKTSNKLIFSVPNTGFIGHRLRLLFGSFPLQWRTNPGEHLRFWTARDMRWWLKQLGLNHDSKLILYEGIPILNKIWPSLFAMGIIVVIKK